MEGVKITSPECHTHRHFDCPVERLNIRCQCLCHKIAGE
jgi:hypothetical protein